MLGFSIATVVLLLLVCLSGATVRFTLGFGDALVAMPVLVLFLPTRVAVPLVALQATTIGLILLTTHKRHVDFKSAWRLLLSSAFGIPVGILLLKNAPDLLLKLLLAFVIVVYALYQLLFRARLHLRTDRGAFAFGFLAGMLGAAWNTNGPPVVMYGTMRRWTPERFRATLQGYFFPTSLVIVASHAASGWWTRPVLAFYAMSLPFIAGAWFLGTWLHRRVEPKKLERAVFVFLIFAGVLVAASALR